MVIKSRTAKLDRKPKPKHRTLTETVLAVRNSGKADKITPENIEIGIERGLRRIAATRRKSQRTLEEIARLREENQALLDKL